MELHLVSKVQLFDGKPAAMVIAVNWRSVTALLPSQPVSHLPCKMVPVSFLPLPYNLHNNFSKTAILQ